MSPNADLTSHALPWPIGRDARMRSRTHSRLRGGVVPNVCMRREAPLEFEHPSDEPRKAWLLVPAGRLHVPAVASWLIDERESYSRKHLPVAGCAIERAACHQIGDGADFLA